MDEYNSDQSGYLSSLGFDEYEDDYEDEEEDDFTKDNEDDVDALEKERGKMI